MLIAAVDGPAAPEVPAALQKAETERLGEIYAELTLADQNLLEPKDGYGDAQQVWSDEVFPTRLGPEQVTLVLARRAPDGTLAPHAPVDDGDVARAWALSEVSLSKHRWKETDGIDQLVPEIAAIRKEWKTWQEGRYFVCPISEGGVITEELRYNAECGLVSTAPQIRG